ncbi:TetR family transcriptional regulator [Microbispora sp. RL4-1S]|uniref:TetR family transcriptional regulator n=1 Tax=Microbispora oryzae TaxID=2806554 RepID=A0A940WV88_9ACTN|nr:TetR family transcriptional regulator [Microbispora oryzae]MBP2707544.1 TetR family transcriptional regulator [Microbispora oryzae]
MSGGERLSRQLVVDKAIELADAHGLETLTIRRLAKDLGVSPMALYWHFKNKDLLLEAVADHVLAEVTVTLGRGAPWNERMRAMIEALIRVLRRHPSMTEIFTVIEKGRVDSFTQATEAALQTLEEAGFALNEAYYVASYLLHGVIALVDQEPGCQGPRAPEERKEWRRQKRLSLESLPPDRFPCMIAFARTYEEEPDIDHYYEFGLGLLVSGLEAMASRRAAGRI